MTIRRRSILATVIITLVLSGTSFVSVAASQTLSVGASADAYVLQASPQKNFGNRRELLVAGGSAPQETYLRFTVSGLSGTVEDARVRILLSNGTSDGPAIHGTGSGWAETSITWNNRPAAGGLIDDPGTLPAGNYAEWNVTGVVTGNNTYNFVLRGGSSDGVAGASRETKTPPQLVITTAGGTPTPTPTPVAAPTPTPTPSPTPTPTPTPSRRRRRHRHRHRRPMTPWSSLRATSRTAQCRAMSRPRTSSMRCPGPS